MDMRSNPPGKRRKDLVRHARLLILPASALFAIILMISPFSTGVALGAAYTATTSNSGNDTETDYFTMGLFSYDDFLDLDEEEDNEELAFDIDDFTPVGTAQFNRAKIYYTVSNGQKVIDKTFNMTPVNLYLAIIGPDVDYRIYEDDLDITVSGLPNATVTSTVTIGNVAFDEVNSCWDLEAGVAYRLSLKSTIQCSYNSSDPDPSVTISVSITSIYSTLNGTFYESPCNITVTESDILQEVLEENEEFEDENEGFQIIQTETFEYEDTSYGSVTISDEVGDGYITHQSGGKHTDIALSLNIPADKSFVINVKSENISATYSLEVLNTTNGDFYLNNARINGSKDFYYTPNSAPSNGMTRHNSFTPDQWTNAFLGNDSDNIVVNINGSFGRGVKVSIVFM